MPLEFIDSPCVFNDSLAGATARKRCYRQVCRVLQVWGGTKRCYRHVCQDVQLWRREMSSQSSPAFFQNRPKLEKLSNPVYNSVSWFPTLGKTWKICFLRRALRLWSLSWPVQPIAPLTIWRWDTDRRNHLIKWISWHKKMNLSKLSRSFECHMSRYHLKTISWLGLLAWVLTL